MTKDITTTTITTATATITTTTTLNQPSPMINPTPAETAITVDRATVADLAMVADPPTVATVTAPVPEEAATTVDTKLHRFTIFKVPVTARVRHQNIKEPSYFLLQAVA